MADDRRWRLASPLAIGLAVAVVLAVVLSLVLWIGSGLRPMPAAFGRSPIGVFGLVLSPVCYAALGAILAVHLPRNPIGWIFLATSVAIGSILPVNLIVLTAHEGLRQPSDVVVWIAWGRTSFASPLVLPLLVIAALIFPDGRPLGGRWRVVMLAATGSGVLLAVATAIDPHGLWSYPSFPNPVAVSYDLEPLVGWLRTAATAVIASCIALAVISLGIRYRQGGDLVRSQLRWIVVAAAVSAIAALPYVMFRFAVEVDDAVGELAAGVAQVGSCALPLAAAFAMSRYRLFDVDVLIGRTLVYLPLMGILGGLYTAGMALFQRVSVALTGETSDVAGIVAILLVASAFTPVRRGLESAIDRRFPARLSSILPDSVPPRPVDPVASADVEATSFPRTIPRALLLPVDAEGAVECPVAGRRAVLDCLSCPHLSATIPKPTLAIACDLGGRSG